MITSSSDGGLFSDSSAGSERVVEQLERARKDEAVKAVVIRINSPGGSAAASEEIYKQILIVRKTKPVYASMGDVAASGGYYIASACDRIYANGSTITGSIGVIMEATDLSGLFDKIGVDVQTIKSGKYKDMGSPSRALTPEEKQLIQGMIDDTYQQFVDAVSAGRKMPRARVMELATGRIYTGRQARNLNLVDEIGGLRDAVLAAGKAGGIKGEPVVNKYGRRGGLKGLLSETSVAENLRSRDYALMLDRLLGRFTSEDNSLESLR